MFKFLSKDKKSIHIIGLGLIMVIFDVFILYTSSSEFFRLNRITMLFGLLSVAFNTVMTYRVWINLAYLWKNRHE